MPCQLYAILCDQWVCSGIMLECLEDGIMVIMREAAQMPTFN